MSKGVSLLCFLLTNLFMIELSAQKPHFAELGEKLTPYFFEGERDAAGWLRWSPQLGEQANFPVSYDGFCYTRLDTVLYINAGELSYAAALFRTTEFMSENQEMMCRSCSPVLSVATFRQKEETWHLQDFEQALPYFGVWNERGPVRLVQVSKDAFGLGIKQKLSGMQGYAEAREQIYYQGVDLLFSYLYEKHLPDRYQLSQAIEFQKTALNPLYDIKLQQTKTYLQGQKEKDAVYFYYDGDLMQYLKK